MILSDKDIKKAIKSEDIIIDPFDKNDLQPASVDLHLGKHFLVFESKSNYVLDPKKPMDDLMEEVTIKEDEPFVMHPGEFALGVVHEMTGVSAKYVGRLEGKSSIGRIGMLIHVTAGFLDPGNCLKMTLELHNTANIPILLYYKMPIAQMAFEKLSSECDRPYSSIRNQYVGDVKPRASQIWKSFKVSKNRTSLK
ncbi:MAG: dCTP deaminase [Patescibacteria group bacterium]